MTDYGRILVAGLGSLGLLIAAFGFQHIGRFDPCPMCIWQRWPHAAAVVIAALAITLLWRHRRALSGLGAAVMLGCAGLAAFHAGVEQGWWTGPTTCAAPDPGGLSSSELLDQILATPMVRCDEIVWSFLGLSMAVWNGIASLALAVVWLGPARALKTA